MLLSTGERGEKSPRYGADVLETARENEPPTARLALCRAAAYLNQTLQRISPPQSKLVL
jgi:hypothetical protein